MNDDVAAAVRSLESSRTALAAALVRPSRHRDRFAGPAASALGGLWSSLADAAGEQWQHREWRATFDRARPAVEEAVRRQPWTAVAVAGLVGAIAVWIVSSRRRLIFSAARLWWRTAGAAILASAAFKWYEQYIGSRDRPVPPADDIDDAESAPED